MAYGIYTLDDQWGVLIIILSDILAIFLNDLVEDDTDDHDLCRYIYIYIYMVIHSII